MDNSWPFLLLRTAEGVRQHFSARWTEWLMLFPLLGIGATLYVQPDMFTRAPHYLKLHEWAEESSWEIVILVAAVFRLSALVINGTFRWFRFAPHFRLAASIVAGAIWAQFSLSALIVFGLTGTTSLGPVISYGTLAIVEFANVFRAARDVGAWARSLG